MYNKTNECIQIITKRLNVEIFKALEMNMY